MEDAAVKPRGESPAGSRYDVRILQALRRIMRAVEIHSHKLSATYRVTAPQLVCLLALRDDGPLTPTSIARRVSLSASTVVGILDRLDEKGLVRRVRDTHDRRLVLVSVTPEGERVCREAPLPLQGTLAEALTNLSVDEQALIARSLERVVDLMEVGHLPAAPFLESGPIDADSGDR